MRIYKLETQAVIDEETEQYKVLSYSYHPNAASVEKRKTYEAGENEDGYPIRHVVRHIGLVNTQDMLDELNNIANYYQVY